MNTSYFRAALYATGAAACVVLAAQAATKTAKFNVTANVQSDCTIGATNMDFGNVGTLVANIDATSTITITCTPTTAFTVGLNEGNVATSTVADRKMGSGAQRLAFQLYRDAARTQVWGVTPPTDTQGGTGTGTAATITVYGRIPVQTTPGIGNYLTEITATITY